MLGALGVVPSAGVAGVSVAGVVGGVPPPPPPVLLFPLLPPVVSSLLLLLRDVSTRRALEA
ncbi:hypothetical protein D1872_229210 [compost metagenome]